jgi:hypothetical protein
MIRAYTTRTQAARPPTRISHRAPCVGESRRLTESGPLVTKPDQLVTNSHQQSPLVNFSHRQSPASHQHFSDEKWVFGDYFVEVRALHRIGTGGWA